MPHRQERGPYAKGLQRRQLILEAALRAYARSGPDGPVLRQIAADAGLSERGISHYFASREELLVAIIEDRERDDAGLRTADGALPGIDRLVELITERHTSTPGIAKLYLDLAVAASDPSHPGHELFSRRYADLRTHFGRLLARDGVVDAAASERLAAVLVAIVDGLQIQWMLDPTLDLRETLELFGRLVGTAGPDDVGREPGGADVGPAEEPGGGPVGERGS